MQVGDILTLRICIGDKKVGDKVIVREVFKTEDKYSTFFNMVLPEVIRGIKLEDIYGIWFLHCFEEPYINKQI